MPAFEHLLRPTLDALPAHIAVLDAAGRVVLVNRAWRRFGGGADPAPDPALGVGADYFAACDRAAAGGGTGAGDAAGTAAGIRAVAAGARAGFALEYPCHGPGEPPRWFRLRAARFEAEGRAWVVVVHEDVTARRVAEEQRGLLIGELAHRVKNTLALVLAVARQTGERAADLPGFLDAFEGRVGALVAAQDLLGADGRPGAPPADLARAALAPHDGEGGRVAVEVEGPPLAPAAAQSLAMVLHELATNAAKYGALSTAGGRVALGGRVEGGELVLAWREAGGPPVAPPRERGFGTVLVERLVAYQHGGDVAFDWRPEGLACTLRLPLAEVAAPGASPAGAPAGARGGGG